jgi:hypothetical protein
MKKTNEITHRNLVCGSPASLLLPQNLLPQQQIAPKHDNVLPLAENFLPKHDNVADIFMDIPAMDFAIARKQGVPVSIRKNVDAGNCKKLLLQEQFASTGRTLSCFRGTPG